MMNREEQLTIACANWLRYQYPPDKFIWYHVANERDLGGKGQRYAMIRGKKLKDMGVRAGVSDFHIEEPRGGHGKLVVEMKVETVTYAAGKKSIQRTYPNETQRDYLLGMYERGYAADVAWDVNQFQDIVISYMKGEWKPSEYMSKIIEKYTDTQSNE